MPELPIKSEYLITNQLGGYCFGDVVNGNTQKYHGVLVCGKKDLSRKNVINTIKETITANGELYELSRLNFVPEVSNPINPIGNIKETLIEKSKVMFKYEFPFGTVIKEYVLAQEENLISLNYKFKTTIPLKFSASPFIGNRAIDRLNKIEKEEKLEVKSYLNKFVIKLTESEELELRVLSYSVKSLVNSDYQVDLEQFTYKNFEYVKEKERGYEYSEDLIKAIQLGWEMAPGESFYSLIFKYKDHEEITSGIVDEALGVDENLLNYDSRKDLSGNSLLDFKNFLMVKGQDFLVDSGKIKTVMAGYPWFSDWGRDTFISFRGLLLVSGKLSFARRVLEYWGNSISEKGLIPNSVKDKAYNSIDASLWWIVACYYYVSLDPSDAKFVNWLYEKVEFIISSYIKGSDYSIGVGEEGFAVWEDKRYALSWMDAIVDGESTSGRIGACVEVQSLWYNAYKIYLYLRKILKIKIENRDIVKNFTNFKKNFEDEFWCEENQYLNDWVWKEEKSNKIRPNAIIALSLPFSLLEETTARKVLKTAENRLLREIGLLTLAMDEEGFIPRYSGTQRERDLAYHNGAIWPFLLGLYLKAYLRVNDNSKVAKDYVFDMLKNYWELIKEKNLNYLAEVYSADDLHADGCITQAWNYGTFLEVFYDFEHGQK